MTWNTFYGFTAGSDVAREVLAGRMTPEQAGDVWVRTADRSHDAGDAFLAAYDAAGAPR